MLRPDGVGHQLLGLGQVTVAGPTVVQTTGVEYVGTERISTEYLRHSAVRASSVAVPGREKTVPSAQLLLADRSHPQFCTACPGVFCIAADLHG